MTLWHESPDPVTLRRELLEALVLRIRAAIACRGFALLALSGGSTPLPLYRDLARQLMPWPRVQFVLVDERWVETSHPASNERALRDALAPAIAAGAGFTGMKNTAPHPADGLPACERQYRALARPFDSVLLGMGEDGHFASLFPGAEGLGAALDPSGAALCAAISAPPGTAAGCDERMSLTLAALRGAGAIDLLVTGERKRALLQAAARRSGTSDLPVGALLAQSTFPLTIWWAPGGPTP